MLLSFAEREFVDVALDEKVFAIEVEPLPVAPLIDEELEERIFRLIAHGLAEGVSGSHGEATGKALIEFELKAVIHGTVADVAQLGVGLPAEGQKLRLSLDIG